MTGPASNEVGARLVLSGRQEFTADARSASTAVTGIGEAATRAGVMATRGAEGFGALPRAARVAGRETESSMGRSGRAAGRSFVTSFKESTRSLITGARTRGREAGERMGEGMKERFKETVKTFAAPVLGFLAAEKGLDFVKEGVAGAQANRIASHQTAAALKTTHHASKQTTAGVGELAEEMSGINAQTKAANQSMLNMILTFPKIRGKQFKETAEAADDLAARFKIALPSAAKVLAKVLNDPAKGLTGLNRVGIKFTKGQQDQITAMVKQGKTAEAQSFILEAVNKRVGGSAAAAVTPQQRFHHALEVMSERLGSKILPVMDKFSKWGVSKGLPMLEKLGSFIEHKVWPPASLLAHTLAKDLLPSLEDMGSFIIKKVIPPLVTMGTWLGKHIVSALQAFGKWASKNKTTVKAFIGTILVLVAAMKIFAAVMFIVDAALDANPVVLIVLAIAALVAGVVYAYTHFKTFRRIVNAVGSAFKAIFNWVKDHWSTISTILFGPIKWAIGMIKSHFGTIKQTVKDVVGVVVAVTKGIGAGFKWAWDHSIGPVIGWIKTGLGDIEAAYNWLVGGGESKTTKAEGKLAKTSGALHGVQNNPILKALGNLPGATPVGNNASGTDYWRGGLTWVGEHGRELLNLPRGSKIKSNASSERALAASNRIWSNNHSLSTGASSSVSLSNRDKLPPIHLHLKLRGKEIAHAVYDQMDHDTAYMEV